MSNPNTPVKKDIPNTPLIIDITDTPFKVAPCATKVQARTIPVAINCLLAYLKGSTISDMTRKTGHDRNSFFKYASIVKVE
jgi:hypothetical protein